MSGLPQWIWQRKPEWLDDKNTMMMLVARVGYALKHASARLQRSEVGPGCALSARSPLRNPLNPPGPHQPRRHLCSVQSDAMDWR